MNEFSLIDTYFKKLTSSTEDVIIGIGDDAACIQVPHACQLLVSTDTLVERVHFLPEWGAHAIAYRACMVNISDIIAMGGTPRWMTLALTLKEINTAWLEEYARGIADALNRYDITLVGGDTTRGPLSMTPTILGFIPNGSAITRNRAQVGDKIYLSDPIGAAALAIHQIKTDTRTKDYADLMQALLYPELPLAWSPIIQKYASAAIDVSDGLSADLMHICTQSGVGACLDAAHIPLHPLLPALLAKKALDFALGGGDDYVLCFTVPQHHEMSFLDAVTKTGLKSHCIGIIEAEIGLRIKNKAGIVTRLTPRGYQHF